MTKRLFLMMFVSLMMVFGFNSCSCDREDKTNNLNGEQAELVVENLISADREYMYLNHGGDYRWYETCITLKDWLDSEECDGTVESVASVFQYLENTDETSSDVRVVLTAHTRDTNAIETRFGFWVGDFPLNEETICINFAQAFERLQEANCPKPHSRHCVLRREIGPVADVAPQYIFGNQSAQVYVDAKTGEVSTENPAFKGFGFKMPLGEWP